MQSCSTDALNSHVAGAEKLPTCGVGNLVSQGAVVSQGAASLPNGGCVADIPGADLEAYLGSVQTGVHVNPEADSVPGTMSNMRLDSSPTANSRPPATPASTSIIVPHSNSDPSTTCHAPSLERESSPLVHPASRAPDAPRSSVNIAFPTPISPIVPELPDQHQHEQNYATPPPKPATQLQHGIRKPKQYTDGTIRYGLLTTSSEPTSHHEAMALPHWKTTMDNEFSTLLNNITCHLVPRQHGGNIINCKWVYKVKKKVDGSIDRYKARLIAK
jgi:hypothetical protein